MIVGLTIDGFGISEAFGQANSIRNLAGTARPFDIVFLDPPFASGLLARAAALLERRPWLHDAALIYVECAVRDGLPALPEQWRPLKGKQAGEVGYHLFARAAPPASVMYET